MDYPAGRKPETHAEKAKIEYYLMHTAEKVYFLPVKIRAVCCKVKDGTIPSPNRKYVNPLFFVRNRDWKQQLISNYIRFLQKTNWITSVF